jgi:hypothetical protein
VPEEREFWDDPQSAPGAVFQSGVTSLTKIDLLSLDVEGSDLDILGALDFARFGPRFICVEHTGAVARGSQALSDCIQQLLASEGYLMRAYNSINAIYQRAD